MVYTLATFFVFSVFFPVNLFSNRKKKKCFTLSGTNGIVFRDIKAFSNFTKGFFTEKVALSRNDSEKSFTEVYMKNFADLETSLPMLCKGG